MTSLPNARDIPVGFGLPGWAWPAIGLGGGIALVLLVHWSCFVEDKC